MRNAFGNGGIIFIITVTIVVEVPDLNSLLVGTPSQYSTIHLPFDGLVLNLDFFDLVIMLTSQHKFVLQVPNLRIGSNIHAIFKRDGFTWFIQSRLREISIAKSEKELDRFENF